MGIGLRTISYVQHWLHVFPRFVPGTCFPAVTCNGCMFYLRAIYMVRLCRMQQAYDRPTTRIVSCKSNLQLAYDCRVRHKKCRRILKHVLKSYDSRRYRQC